MLASKEESIAINEDRIREIGVEESIEKMK